MIFINKFSGKQWLINAIVIFIVVLSIFARTPDFENITWIDSDATYHEIMNAEATKKESTLVHHFVPLITYNEICDKGVDYIVGAFDRANSNFYYTSFPSLGFAYISSFIKLTGAQTSELYIYIMSSILLVLSLFLTIKIFCKIFEDRLPCTLITIICALLYAFSPEIMHSQGLVYWGQSLFQVTFLFQLLLYLRIYVDKDEKAYYRILYFIMFLINPMIEWTGYISNLAFFLVSLFFSFSRDENGRIKIVKEHMKISIIICCATLIAIITYLVQTLSVISLDSLIENMTTRAMVRTTGYKISELLKGISHSFCFFLVILIICLFVLVIQKKWRASIKDLIKQDGIFIFLIVFPLLENLIFLGHAILYTFDRMKYIFIIIYLFLIILCVVYTKRKILYRLVVSCLFLSACYQYYAYSFTDNYYIHRDVQLHTNQQVKKYVEPYKDNGVYGQSLQVWGYTKYLFDKGVYGKTSLSGMKEISKEAGTEYSVFFDVTDKMMTQYWYHSVFITNLATGKTKVLMLYDKINIGGYKYLNAIIPLVNNVNVYIRNIEKPFDIIQFEGNETSEEKLNKINKVLGDSNENPDEIFLEFEISKSFDFIVGSNLIDYNWSNGISRSANQILFENNEVNVDKLADAEKFIVKDAICNVGSISENDNWISVDLVDCNSNINEFANPNIILIVK